MTDGMRSMIDHAQLLLMAILVSTPITVSAEILLIGNSALSVNAISREEAINIYMGRFRKLPDGAVVTPLDQSARSPVRRDFYRRLVDKTPEEINTYWTRLLFSGNTQRPAEIQHVDDMLTRIANDARAIGYVERRQVDGLLSGKGLKVLLVFPE